MDLLKRGKDKKKNLPSRAEKYCFFCSRETSKHTDVFAFSQRLSHGTIIIVKPPGKD